MKKRINRFGWALARLLGRQIRDAYSGEVLGKAIVFFWSGKLYILGYSGDKPIVPVFSPKKELSYWCSSLGFTTHDQPDYERK